MREIETRVINIDVDDIRHKLSSLKTVKVKEENQINHIFDFNDRRLLKDKGYARIRVIEDMLKNETRYYMTTKKMISQEKYKLMEENETIIKDGDEGINIFKSLGLELVESIKKYRESYKYKNTLVEIDINDKSFCPFPYIEVESPSEEELLEVLNHVGYTLEETTSKTIYEIIGDYNNSNLKGL
ncbi:class IV adenylate cyclase [Clostridium sp.]|uniref:class IV adenylate cyclase n=1 Tax=Clostridium sp. TaxID=1506 RepID=UPI003463D70A